MLKIILDTNFLVDIYRFKISLKEQLSMLDLEPYRLFVLDKTIDELKKLSLKSRDARVSLELSKKFFVMKAKGDNVDDILAGLKGNDIIIATDDKELKKRLKCKKLVIRKKSYLALED